MWYCDGYYSTTLLLLEPNFIRQLTLQLETRYSVYYKMGWVSDLSTSAEIINVPIAQSYLDNNVTSSYRTKCYCLQSLQWCRFIEVRVFHNRIFCMSVLTHTLSLHIMVLHFNWLMSCTSYSVKTFQWFIVTDIIFY